MSQKNDDLISRRAVIDVTYEVVFVEYNDLDPHKEKNIIRQIKAAIRDRIKALPSAQPKHGEWEYHSNPTIGINPEDAYCSCCGFHVDTTGDIDFDEYNFCPRCGADMRGEAE